MTHDVLICGCGPVGALLAALLVERGHTVAVVERHSKVYPVPRAMVLDDESLRILQVLGVDAQIDLRPTQALTYTDAQRRPLVRMELPPDRRPYGHPVMATFSQPELEAVLRARLEQAPNATLLLGWEAEHVEDTGAVVSLRVRSRDGAQEQELRGRFLVGCDGGKSFVAAQLGGEVEDLGWSQDWVVMDAQAADDPAYDQVPDDPEMRCQPGRAALLIKGVRGHLRLDRMAGEDRSQDQDREAGRARLGHYLDDPERFEITRQVRYTFTAASPRAWRVGRVLLAGDAAHQTPPFAGQGLNMGLRDASNLAFKLDLVLTGRASDDLLDTYAQERRPPTLETIRGAIRSGRIPTASHPLAIALRDLVFLAVRTVPVLADQLRGAIISKPPYTAGLLGSHRRAGHLLPQPHLGQERLDDRLGPGWGLISLDPVDETIIERAHTLDVTVVTVPQDDPGASVLVDFLGRGTRAALIRPDRYVFEAAASAQAVLEALESRLQRA